MNKGGSKVLLIFALIFVTITSVLLAFELILSFISFDAIYHPGNDGWDVVGGVLVYVYVFLLGIFASISGAAILPFDIVLLKKVGKRWFTLAILIFAISAIAVAVIMAAALPIVASVNDAINSSSSSSSISSSSAFLIN